jgi:hypothetical protein
MQFSRTALFVIIIVVGLVVGLIIGQRFSGSGDANVEAYLRLVATLYAEGESIDSIRDRLRWMESYDLPSVLRGLADKYNRSNDPQKVREAAALGRLGDALATAPKVGPTPRPKTGATPLPPIPTAGALPTVGAATPAGTPAASGQPTPTAGGKRPPLSASQLPRVGTIGGGSTNLRSRPATSGAPVVRIIPDKAKVRINRVVEGEAVNPGEPWWYEIEYEGSAGFVYYSYVEP